MMQKISSFLMGVASLYHLGQLRAGGFLASLMGLAIVVGSHFVYYTSHDLYYQLIIILGSISMVAVHHAALTLTVDQYSKIIVTKIWAMILLYAYLPITLHFIAFGWMIYQVIWVVGFLRRRIVPFSEADESAASCYAMHLMYNDFVPALIANLFLQIVHAVR